VLKLLIENEQGRGWTEPCDHAAAAQEFSKQAMTTDEELHKLLIRSTKPAKLRRELIRRS